jgi:hypothetical protein
MKHLSQNEKRCQEKFWIPKAEEKEKRKGNKRKSRIPAPDQNGGRMPKPRERRLSRRTDFGNLVGLRKMSFELRKGSEAEPGLEG